MRGAEESRDQRISTLTLHTAIDLPGFLWMKI